MESGLAASGWYLSQEGLSKCQAGCTEKGWPTSDKNVIKIANDSDLRAIAESRLPRNLGAEVHGPLVLQIQKVKNVAVSSRKQHLSSPGRRLLRLYFTDGHVQHSGIEIEGPLEKLSPTTPPGTKVKLRGTVKVQHGFLLLTKSSLEVLGGEVEHLLKKWNAQKFTPGNLDRSKSGGTNGPPQFTAFRVDGSRIKKSGVATHQSQPQQGGRTMSHHTYSSSEQHRASSAYSRPPQSDRHTGSKGNSSESGIHRTQPPQNKQQARDTFPSKRQDLSLHSQSYRENNYQQRNRTDRRLHEDARSRDFEPPRGTSRGRGLREPIKDRGERSQAATVHKTPYDKKERWDGGTGRGRGHGRLDEREYESQRPKKSYDLADFFGDKLQLTTTSAAKDSSEDRSNNHSSRNLSDYESKRGRDMSAQEKRSTKTGSDYRHRGDKQDSWRRERPLEAWVDERDRTVQTTKREFGTHHEGEHQMPPRRGRPRYKGRQQTVKMEDSDQKGHWDWISGSGSSVPYSARKQ